MGDNPNSGGAPKHRPTSRGSVLTPGGSLKRAIHHARIDADIRSDRQLAKDAGVRYATIMAWYSGTAPSTSTLRPIATRLGVPIARLWAAWELKPDKRPPEVDDLGGLSDLAQAIRDLTEQVSRLAGRGDLEPDTTPEEDAILEAEAARAGTPRRARPPRPGQSPASQGTGRRGSDLDAPSLS